MKNRRNIVELKYPPENPNDIWLKDGKFYRSTSEGWIVIDSKTEYTSKESMIADNPKGGTIGIDKETGEASIYNDVAEQWSPLSGGGVTSITWKELKDKRDAGKLIPGSLYRITDYNCTTTQENTQSAGHQFDIVLLALSENKLAEEGWAMMHDNIYDVTFADGIVKKCYIYRTADTNDGPLVNVVDIDTKLGLNDLADDEIIINETDKTATITNVAGYESIDLAEENLPYNYFQNSNLSAWKVWYCLDNDKSRFAWAQKSKIMYKATPFDDAFEVYVSNNTRIYDSKTYYACLEKTDNQDVNLYVLNKDVNVNTEFYTFGGPSGQEKPFVAIGVTIEPEGTGVIYRLIDEFNNDVAYDFKNIQYVRKLTNGEYNADNGIDTWVYTFAAYDIDNNICLDCSMINGRDNIVNETELCANNTIKAYIKAYIDTTVKYELSNNSIVQPLSRTNEEIPNIIRFFIDGGSYNNTIGHGDSIQLINCSRCSFSSFYSVTAYYVHGRSMDGAEVAILIDNKKVLTET